MKYEDLEWVTPLLKAVADGRTLQYSWTSNGTKEWRDIIHPDTWGFSWGKEFHRIKPEPVTPKYKRYLFWSEFTNPNTRVLCHHIQDEPYRPENYPGFIKWIDTEWQKVGV
jgi:hypothetical protein